MEPTVKHAKTIKLVPVVMPQDLEKIVLAQNIITRKKVIANVTNVETNVKNVTKDQPIVPFVEKT